ncbi:stearoyl-CoA desaturase 5 [Fopius arisanus]|uniref:SCD5_0 protein n=1 Tax=Fopius arisanus TaxID=64838 RepID=A0A0C9RPQ9_9HYME|nr:PREDICTED: stearoyl-CoA desaturase 5-like [Fopius arisanus]
MLEKINLGMSLDDNPADSVNGIDMLKDEKKKWWEFETELKWKNIIILSVFHLMSLYFIITFNYRKELFLTFWIIVMVHLSAVGVTGGVHRLWSHRSYKAKLPLQIILALLYASAGLNRIYDWVRDHRIHHKYSDTDADPHNSSRGLWFSHVGWLMMKKHPEVVRKGRAVDMSDIETNPVITFVDRHFTLFKIIFSLIIPVFIPVYLFNQNLKATIIAIFFIKNTILLNGIWSINSIAHNFGYQPYDKSIKPSDNFMVGLVSFGEGWHNYHHVFPWDYRAAEMDGILFNSTKIWLDLFAKIGWVYDMKKASPELIQKVKVNKGDGSVKAHRFTEISDEIQREFH